MLFSTRIMTSMFALGVSVRLSPLLLLLVACGGVVREGTSFEPDGGVAAAGSGGEGSASGGVPGFSGGGTNVGGMTYSGGSPGVAGGVGCCFALAQCNPGDQQIAGPDACPLDATCYQNSVCCSTVWCASPSPICNAVPVCNSGDKQFGGPCPAGYGCYARTACGTTIDCLHPLALMDAGSAPSVDSGLTCSPSTEYSRTYVSTNPGKCDVVDFACPPNTTTFANFCGCGCQQSSTCPEWVDCAPSSSPSNPLCGDAGRTKCPYTKIAS